MQRTLPVLTCVIFLLMVWYGMAIAMNAKWARERAAKAGHELTFSALVGDTLFQERPVLPAAHQVLAELWRSTFGLAVTSKRSLVFHGWITLRATLLGFLVGTMAGILLAVGVICSRTMDMSLMPWAIASQTIPILAIAPIVIVVLNAVGLQGLLPKAIISAYLSFFPVLVGMVRGLRAPQPMLLDLMHTYRAGAVAIFFHLRLPACVPFLFVSMKVAIAAALVGAIVGELPTGAVRGLGARLLTGSYYGQTIQIWAALFAAAFLAATLVAIVGWLQRRVVSRMGMA